MPFKFAQNEYWRIGMDEEKMIGMNVVLNVFCVENIGQ